MKKREEKLVKQWTVTELTCNRCGGSQLDEYNNVLGLDTVVSGNYNSKDLEDGTMYSFSLCESCLLWLFSQFKHQPDTERE